MSQTLNDGVIETLSGYAGTSNDRIMAWLRSKISPSAPTTATLNDLWNLYTTQLGYTSGSLDERIRAFMLNSVGGIFPGLSTYNDIQNAYWNFGGGATLPTDATYFIDRVITGWTLARAGVGMDVSLANLVTFPAINTPAYFRDQGIFNDVSSANSLSDSINMISGGLWDAPSLTRSVPSQTGPDGSNTQVCLCVPTNIGGGHALTKLGVTTGGVSRVLSIWGKPAGYNFIRAVVGSEGGAIFNVSTGTFTLLNGNETAKMVAYGDGWYRCSVFIPASAGTPSAAFTPSPTGSVSFPGDGVSGVYFYGPQLEYSVPSVTEYMRTPTAGTRPFQTISRTVASLVGFTGDNFTLRAAIQVPSPSTVLTGVVRTIFSMFTSAGVQITLQLEANNGFSFIRNSSAGSATVSATAQVWSAGDILELIITQSTVNGMIIKFNSDPFTNTTASAKVAYTSGALPTTLVIGNTTTGSSPMPQLIQEFQYWNTPQL